MTLRYNLAMAAVCMGLSCGAQDATMEPTQVPFVDALLSARQAWQEMAKIPPPANFKVYTSKLVKGKDPAEKITVDVSGCDWLVLYANGVPDFNSGHAVWGEATMTDTKGKPVKLVDLPIEYSHVGWANLEVKKPGARPELRVGDRTFTHGVYAHADSVVEYKLDKKYAVLDLILPLDIYMWNLETV